MKTVQLMNDDGGNMHGVIRNPRIKKRSSAQENKPVKVELTASQRRILQLIATGIEGEPDVLAAGRP
ncbi:hypothetical protein [Pseudomonas frederiksbergensis]|uniref:hypothetical protein n=1 Tax=Pseudomonas frederiksbergensis TaxID=104087 RepID=UPI0011CDC461|nr:hypothetical protein [Pseudomonas frederiksbergensis]